MSRQTLRRIVPFVVLTVVFAALLYRAEHKAETGISHVDQHVTEITSPCLRYGPGSRPCKRSIEAAVETIDHAEACAVLRKAGLRVDSCHGARLAQEQRRHVEQSTSSGPTASVAPDGGDANSVPPGHSQPAPGNGGGGSTEVGGGGGVNRSPEKLHPTGGGHEPGSSAPPVTPASTAPAAPNSSGSTSSSTTERTTESTLVEPSPQAEAPVRAAAGGLVEGVGNVVEETGGTVNGVVEGAAGTTCSLAKVLCGG